MSGRPGATLAFARIRSLLAGTVGRRRKSPVDRAEAGEGNTGKNRATVTVAAMAIGWVGQAARVLLVDPNTSNQITITAAEGTSPTRSSA